MTKEEKDKILILLTEDRNDYARDCERRITAEQGKIIGADYMIQRFLDILGTAVEPQESEDEPSLQWEYMYDFCSECTEKLLGEPPKPLEPQESEDKEG